MAQFTVMTQADLAAYHAALLPYIGDLMDAVDAKSLKTVSTTTSAQGITFKFYDVENPTGSTEPKISVTVPDKASNIEYTAESGTPGQEGYQAQVTIKAALDDLYTQVGSGGSVAAQIAAAIAGLDSSITATTNQVIASFSIVDGEIDTNSVTKVTLADVATSGTAGDVAVVDEDNNFTSSDVEGVLAELAEQISDSTDAGKISIEETSGAGDILKTYSFYQGVLQSDDAATKASKLVSTINIPKDYLVKSATVEVVTTADTPYQGAVVGDKYVDFVINTKDGDGTGTAQHLYIAVNDMIHPISGSVGTEITVTVDNNNQIGAVINSIMATKIIYKAQVGEQGDQDYQAQETVAQALARLDAAVGTGGSVDTKIAAAINDLDATVSIEDAQGTNPLNIQVTQVNGVVTGVTGSIDANTFDAYGAASTVEATLKGGSTDTASSETIAGAKAYADSLAGNYATAAQGALADTALQSADIERIGTEYINGLFADEEEGE